MNEFLTYMVEKLGKGRPPSPTNVSWNVVPKINAVFRNGTQDDRAVLINGFMGNVEPETAIKVATRCHSKQTREVKALFDSAINNLNIYKNCVVAMINNEHKEYTGLLANKLMSKYNKTAFVFRKLDPCTLSGSYRSPVDIIGLLNGSGLITAQGHGCAAGCFLKVSNAKRFVKWFDEQQIDMVGVVEVAASIEPSQITQALCQICVDNEGLFGQGCPKPLFHCTLTTPQIYVYRNRSTTVKLIQDGIEFIKFFVSNEEASQFEQADGKSIEVVVSLGLNEYNGQIKPQAVIERYEIVDKKNDEFDWERIFQ
mgnify:FL=1